MDRSQGAGGPGTIDRSECDGKTESSQMMEPLLEGSAGDETDVRRSPGRTTPCDLGFVGVDSKLDPLVSESKRSGLVVVGDVLESKDPAVEAGRMVGIADRQDQVFDCVD